MVDRVLCAQAVSVARLRCELVFSSSWSASALATKYSALDAWSWT
jgi:hypothetical protein